MFGEKMKDIQIKQVLSGGEYQWEGGKHKKRMKEDEYGGRFFYSCVKLEQ
jgi:hypothetical protein